ncbi:hypothetical protein CC2G_013242 [Coprinopsis cinerea AmutBmut pab1-1]|nr:hypothetical protein CC2G_013242 [Coprinopsis cinerea AmutBmut pab1-1]
MSQDYCAYYLNIFVDRDMFMRIRGGGVGHKNTSTSFQPMVTVSPGPSTSTASRCGDAATSDFLGGVANHEETLLPSVAVANPDDGQSSSEDESGSEGEGGEQQQQGEDDGRPGDGEDEPEMEELVLSAGGYAQF